MPEQSSGSLQINENQICKPQFYFSVRMAEWVLYCVAESSDWNCVEILRMTELNAGSIISCATYDSCFYVGVIIILFSSHLHILYFPSVMENLAFCTLVSSVFLIDLPAGHKSKWPQFSVKFCSEVITSEFRLCTNLEICIFVCSSICFVLQCFVITPHTALDFITRKYYYQSLTMNAEG